MVMMTAAAAVAVAGGQSIQKYLTCLSYEDSTMSVPKLIREYLTIFTHQATSKKTLSNILAIIKPNLLPATFGQIASLIQSETLTIHKSHICVSECLVFKGDDIVCSNCNEARFKPADSIGRKMPRRMFSHTSIGETLELAFGCKNIAQIIQSAEGCQARNIITDIRETLFCKCHQSDCLKIVLGFNTPATPRPINTHFGLLYSQS